MSSLYDRQVEHLSEYIKAKYKRSTLGITAVMTETHLTKDEINTYRRAGFLTTYTPKNIAILILHIEERA